MTEATISQYTRNELSKRGFHVLKHNDSSRSGVPDMTIHQDHKTLWVEDKLLKISKGITGDNPDTLSRISVSARDFIEPERMTQMVEMVKLERFSFAQYWIYVEYSGKCYISILSPSTVWKSYRSDTKILMDLVLASQHRAAFAMPA